MRNPVLIKFKHKLFNILWILYETLKYTLVILEDILWKFSLLKFLGFGLFEATHVQIWPLTLFEPGKPDFIS